MFIRAEVPVDYEEIRDLNCLAFHGDDEARLIDRLREEGVVLASLVAIAADQIVGHILFSEIVIESATAGTPAAALAPMAVGPGWQNQGIGSALVREGLATCKDLGRTIVIVVGHPDYYPRFGFSAELAKPLESAYSCAGDAWMAIELVPGALAGVSGTVHYARAFSELH
jgi:putative acetyltransferase